MRRFIRVGLFVGSIALALLSFAAGLDAFQQFFYGFVSCAAMIGALDK